MKQLGLKIMSSKNEANPDKQHFLAFLVFQDSNAKTKVKNF